MPKKIIQLNEEIIKNELKELVRASVDEFPVLSGEMFPVRRFFLLDMGISSSRAHMSIYSGVFCLRQKEGTRTRPDNNI